MASITLKDVAGGVFSVDHNDITAVYVTRIRKMPITTVCWKPDRVGYVEQKPDEVRSMVEAEVQKERNAKPTFESGVELIAKERDRQVSAEGFKASHDDGHDEGELIHAANCYLEFPLNIKSKVPRDWPWEKSWWKPSDDYVRNLTKAGALIAAEIDRVQRGRSK